MTVALLAAAEHLLLSISFNHFPPVLPTLHFGNKMSMNSRKCSDNLIWSFDLGYDAWRSTTILINTLRCEQRLD